MTRVLAEIGLPGQELAVLDGGDVDPVSGRLLSVAELQQALRAARAGGAAPVGTPPLSRNSSRNSVALPPFAALPDSMHEARTRRSPTRLLRRSARPVEAARIADSGPSSPQRDPTGLSTDGGPPFRPVRPEPATASWVVGVSGGCGESVLATLLTGAAPGTDADPVRAADHRWPSGDCDRVVLCARTNMSSLLAAQRAAAQWAAGATPGVRLLGLVLMADAPGRDPRPIADLADVLAGGVPRQWRIPWIHHWRLDPPDHRDLPRSVITVLADIRASITAPTS